MTMKINPLSDAYASSGIASTKADGKSGVSSSSPVSRATPATTAEVTSPASVSVRLSGSVQSVSALAATGEVYNLDKVQSIRGEIENGTYRVNPEVIADGLMAEARMVLASGR
jgi:negative regulator of flagellin synthesis FlgM